MRTATPDALLPRVALVGVSGYGRILLAQLERLAAVRRLQLAAAVVINPAEEAETCARLRAAGCRIHADLTSMLRAEAPMLDLCLLPTPIHLHRAMTEEVLAAGVNVLLEKPVAATTAEVDAIIAAARRHQRLVAIGFQNLYSPEVQHLKRRLVGGELGRLSAVDVLVHWPRDTAYFNRNRWAGRLKIGDDWVLDSPLNNAAAHFLMLALFLAGPAFAEGASVTALEGELYRAQSIESFDTAGVRFFTADGCRLTMLVSHSCRESAAPVVRVWGERGTAEWQFEYGLRFNPQHRPAEFLRAADMMTARGDMVERVLDRLADGASFICTPELAREHTRCINALHDHLTIRDLPPAARQSESIGTGEQVFVPGIEAQLRRCWETGALPSEAGVPWAEPAQRSDLTNYMGLSGARPVTT